MESQDLAATMFLITMLAFYMVMLKQDEQNRRLRRLERMLRSVPGAGEADEELHPKVIAKIGEGKINAAIILHRTIAAVPFAESQAAVNSYIARQD